MSVALVVWLSEGADDGCIFRKTKLRERVHAHGGAVGQQFLRGARKCFLLWAVTGVQLLGIDIEQEPYSVLHAKFSFSLCQRHLRAFLLSIPFHVSTHTHTWTQSLALSLPGSHISLKAWLICVLSELKLKQFWYLKAYSVCYILIFTFCCSLLFPESTQVLTP